MTSVRLYKLMRDMVGAVNNLAVALENEKVDKGRARERLREICAEIMEATENE